MGNKITRLEDELEGLKGVVKDLLVRLDKGGNDSVKITKSRLNNETWTYTYEELNALFPDQLRTILSNEEEMNDVAFTSIYKATTRRSCQLKLLFLLFELSFLLHLAEVH